MQRWFAARLDEGRRRIHIIPLATALLLLGSAAVVACLHAASQSVLVPVFQLDGSFQTASGLFRLRDGDLPGRDFLPYLGIGPVFLLYPVFALSGGLLTGSVFSAHLVTAAVVALTAGTVVSLLLRVRSAAVLLGASGVFLAVAVSSVALAPVLPAPLAAFLAPVAESAVPGNSLRPLRAAGPLLLVAATVLSLDRLPGLRGVVATGASFGVVMACWSNDYALLPGAVVLVLVLHHGVRIRGWRLREVASLFAALLVGAAVSGLLATGGHYLAYARYNLVDVLGDQFWYFAGGAAKDVITSPADLVRVLAEHGGLWGLPLLAFLLVRIAIRPALSETAVAALGVAVLAGGCVAVIGGHVEDYFLAFRLWTTAAWTAAVLVLLRLPVTAVLRRGTARTAGVVRRAGAVLALVGVVSVLVVSGVDRARATDAARATAAADPSQVYSKTLGGWIGTAFTEHLATAPQQSRFIEEYAGLWTVERGPNRTTRVDAAIHALGAQRAGLARALAERPKAAVTSAVGVGLQYVAWSFSANWWFYEPLLTGYSPRQSSPYTIVWTRTAPAPAGETGRCAVSAGGDSITATPVAEGLNEVTVRYDGPGRGTRSFSSLENGIDGVADHDGFVPLDPGASQQSVPVYAASVAPMRLRLRDVPDGARTVLRSCSIRTVPLARPSAVLGVYGALLTAQASPIGYTGGEFVDGISTSRAALAFDRTIANLRTYRSGTRVRLADGEVRRVLAQVVDQDRLLVYLDGAAIPPSALTPGPAVTASP